MKKYIFKTKRNAHSRKQKVMIYKRNYKLLKEVSKYKNFLINTKSACQNKNGEYDAKLVLEHLRKNMEMMNKVFSEGDKIYKETK